MPYLALFRHQWQRRWRAPRPRLFWLAVLLGGLMLTYAVVGAVFLGLGAEILALDYAPGRSALGIVNSLVPGAALVLLVLRFLFQRPPLRDVTPYLGLPIRRARLARFFALSPSLSLHNALPMCFAAAFALRTVTHAGGGVGALCWLGGFAAVLVALDLLNTYLRAVLGAQPLRFLLLCAVIGGALALDAWRGPNVAMVSVWTLFSALSMGNVAALAALWVGIGALGFAVTRHLERRLVVQARASRTVAPELSFGVATPVYNLLRLELALILRHKRPRQFVLISLAFSTVYTVLILRGGSPSLTVAVLIGFMSSGMFALNYGPLMFGWESAFFDGILARPTLPVHLVTSKVLLLQLSCVCLFLVALPFFLIWAPGFVGVHAAMMFYNAGICVPFVLWLALGNRDAITLERSSLFNYQGVSFKHMAWSLLLIIPPFALTLGVPQAAPMLIAVLGLAGIGATLLLLHPIALRLSRARHEMARAFRAGAH